MGARRGPERSTTSPSFSRETLAGRARKNRKWPATEVFAQHTLEVRGPRALFAWATRLLLPSAFKRLATGAGRAAGLGVSC
jgi:hypothetical protein